MVAYVVEGLSYTRPKKYPNDIQTLTTAWQRVTVTVTNADGKCSVVLSFNTPRAFVGTVTLSSTDVRNLVKDMNKGPYPCLVTLSHNKSTEGSSTGAGAGAGTGAGAASGTVTGGGEESDTAQPIRALCTTRVFDPSLHHEGADATQAGLFRTIAAEAKADAQSTAASSGVPDSDTVPALVFYHGVEFVTYEGAVRTVICGFPPSSVIRLIVGTGVPTGPFFSMLKGKDMTRLGLPELLRLDDHFGQPNVYKTPTDPGPIVWDHLVERRVMAGIYGALGLTTARVDAEGRLAGGRYTPEGRLYVDAVHDPPSRGAVHIGAPGAQPAQWPVKGATVADKTPAALDTDVAAFAASRAAGGGDDAAAAAVKLVTDSRDAALVDAMTRAGREPVHSTTGTAFGLPPQRYEHATVVKGSKSKCSIL